MERGARIAIVATDGFEQSELQGPLDGLRKAGFKVGVLPLKTGQIRGWKGKDRGDLVDMAFSLDQADSKDYPALVLPGGVVNPDILRTK